MKTKIVYTLISSDSDIYMEQMLVSVFSLKHFTPNAYVTVVADRDTSVRIEKWELLRGYVDGVISIAFDVFVSNKERSRWIKTNLRNLVEGDFLFLDTDTVITADLSEIDNITSEIAMVPDLHCHPFSEHPFQVSIKKRIKQLFQITLSSDSIYFNSGVILCKDTEHTRLFFNKWHKTWLIGKDKKSGVFDQRSLAVVCEQMKIVESLPDDYNCQVMGSIEYLYTAKIVHFFNAKWTDEPKTLSPFYDNSFYKQIKGKDYLPVDIQGIILHCKSSFCSPSMIVDKSDMCIWRTPVFMLVRRLYKHHQIIFMLVNNLSRLLLFVKRKIKTGGGVNCDSQYNIVVTCVRLQFINKTIAA